MSVSANPDGRHSFTVPWALIALGLAIIVQGAAGRPAPPGMRWVEALITTLAALAIGGPAIFQTLLGRHLAADQPEWTRVGGFCLLVTLWCPSVVAAIAGWPWEDVIRDVVPSLFLFAPLALVPPLERHGARGANWLCGALMIEGVLLIARWWRHGQWGFGAVGARALEDGGAYLLNAPSVLFATLALPSLALTLAAQPGWWRKIAAVAVGALAALGGLALLGAAHRLALGLIMVGGGVTALWHARRALRAVAIVAVLVCALIALEADRLIAALQLVQEKTRLAGANNRLEEVIAALGAAGHDLVTATFGHGWGATLENPAVGGWRVSYTHNLGTYTLFKSGLVGLIAITIWLATVARAAPVAWRRHAPLTFAILAPLVTAFTLHTSFKYLDTGLLMTALILRAGVRDQQSYSNTRSHAL